LKRYCKHIIIVKFICEKSYSKKSAS